MSDETNIKTPWHLWVVGSLGVLWNGMGALDFTMIQLRIDQYMAMYTPDQLDFFYSFPQWANATWAIAVWFSVLGSVYLLMRKRAAVPLFWVALFAMLATTLHNFLLSDVSMMAIMGPGAAGFTLAIIVVAVLMVIYSLRMRDNRVLA